MKEAIAKHCDKVARQMITLCGQLRKKCYEIRMRLISQYKVEPVLMQFLEDIKKVAGKGVGHIFALNFCQVASLFGFMPMEMVTWASVSSKSSGAYKAISMFYNKTSQKDSIASDLSESEAQKHFDTAVSWIGGHVSGGFTHALAENILCELNREKCIDIGSPEYVASPKKDVLYMYKHRKGILHPLYRWKSDLRGRTILQVLLIDKTGAVEGIHDIMFMKRDSLALVKEDDDYWATLWMDDRYELSPEYCGYL
jgi:hypothetical protein